MPAKAKPTDSSKVLAGLNDAQRQAVTHGKGPLLIVAGAGTGKTKVITTRIAHLIENEKVPADQILAMTFTEKAAGEMLDRLIGLRLSSLPEHIQTYHAFGDALLREYSFEVGLPPTYELLGDAEQVIFLEDHLEALPLKKLAPRGNPVRYLEHLAQAIRRAKAECLTPEAYRKLVEKRCAEAEKLTDGDDRTDALRRLEREEEVATAYAAYERLKDERHFVDFGDQIMKVLELFKKHPEIAARVRKRFPWVLVDEYQDTSPAQAELVRQVTGARGNLTVVGDDDQSIYGFQGARVGNILDFADEQDGATSVVLKENYRSSQPILDAAARLIEHNPDRLAAAKGFDKRLVAQKVTDTAEPQLLKFPTVTDEADAIAKRFKAHHEQGVPWSEMAVLVRQHKLSDHFANALAAAGIPRLVSGSGRLYDQPEVKLAVNFLLSCADPHDSPPLKHLAASPVYDVPMDALFAAARQMRHYHKSLYEVFTWTQGDKGKQQTLPRTAGKEQIKKLLDDIRDFARRARNRPVDEVLFDWLTEAGYAATLRRDGREQEVENLGRLFTRLRQYAATAADPTLTGWAKHYGDVLALSTEEVASEFDFEQDAVRVMTVHGAKGLEFTAVAVAGMVDGKFPSRGRAPSLGPEALLESDPAAAVHEERRLAYVALTRAKRFCYLTASTDYQSKLAWRLSRFVTEAIGESVAAAMPERPEDPWRALKQSMPRLAAVGAANLPETLRLSHSRLSDYWTCPLKYYWNHVAGFPTERAFVLEYGGLIHRVIERINRVKLEGGEPKLADALDWFEQGAAALPEERAGQRAHVQERGREAITRFFTEEASRAAPMAVEREFKVALPGCVVTGRLDRLDSHHGKVTIVDYKTGEAVSTQKKADDRIKQSADQLRIYALAHAEEHGQAPEQIVFNFVETGFSAAAVPTAKQISDMRDRIIETAAEIKKQEYVPNPSAHECSPFADCPGHAPAHRTQAF